MKTEDIDRLHHEGLLNHSQKEILTSIYSKKIFSLYYEIRVAIYLGVLLLSTGLGIAVYKNIDTIGHAVIIAFLAIGVISCYAYIFKNRLPYSTEEVKSIGVVFDYVALLGSLLFLVLEGYLQYQYNIFGEKYGIATLIPALLFLYLAYLIDHKGILSLGITSLGAWAGLTVTPFDLWKSNDFQSSRIIFTGFAFSIVLIAGALYLNFHKIKKHFTFTYLNFGFHILFVSCLSALFVLDMEWLYFLSLILITGPILFYGKHTQTFYFILIAAIYGYIGLTYTIIHYLSIVSNGEGLFWFMFFYFIASCILIILSIFKYKSTFNK